MIIPIYRREYAILRAGWCCARWIDYDFAPIEHQAREWTSDADYLHRSQPLAPVEVEVPAGAKIVERLTTITDKLTGPRLVRVLCWYGDAWGLTAGAVYMRAMVGSDKEFRMAKRRKDDGPDLFGFGFEPAAAAVGAYGQPADIPDPGPVIPADREIIPAPAPEPAAEPLRITPPWEDDGPVPFGRSGDAIDRADRLEAAIREALPWLIDDDGQTPRPLTARNILEAALGETAGTAQDAVA